MGLQTASTLVCLCVLVSGVAGAREFFISVSEELWDYEPNGDVSSPNPTQQGSKHVFKKAVYKEYTDISFTKEKPKHKWLGFLGPMLFAEQGDLILVAFFNNASRPYSIHSHGVLYDKNNEGALYADGHHGNISSHAIDIVEPGWNYTYRWFAIRDASPREGDPDCLTWLYHSHVDSARDINSGLVGFFLTCRPGTLVKTDHLRHYSLYVSVTDESKSWYADENKKRFAQDTSVGAVQRTSFPAINGFLYGNVPDLNACVGETVTWHMAGLGSESDMHALSISGHSFEFFHRRKHIINLSVGQFVTAKTTSVNPGKWLINCNVMNHARDGMNAFLNVRKCDRLLYRPKRIKKIRWHYIAAEEITWSYGPTGKNGLNGEPLTKPGSVSEFYFKKDNITIGGTYKKVVFRAYDDYHFKSRKQQDNRPEYLGVLGPVIKAEVGDMIQVVFKNMASRPYSMHAEGVTFSKKSEGSFYNDGSAESADNKVAPGKQYTYYWFVPEDMSPTESDPQCLTRTYTSGVDPIKDTHSGLIGPLLVCKPDTLDRQEKQMILDHEFILMISIIDENLSWYLEENIRLAGLDKEVTKLKSFRESNKRNSINGLMYSNLLGLHMCVGDSIGWHVISVGSSSELHSFYLHGNIFSSFHTHHNSIGVLPGSRRTLYTTPQNPGTWELNCLTNGHPASGEMALYQVHKCQSKRPSQVAPVQGITRTFYLQAEEVYWDYAPTGQDLINGGKLPDKPRGYMKVFYRGYTDETFKTRLNQTGEEYLGMLGPLLRVETGDILKIVFRNKGNRPFSIHPQGLVYDMASSKKKEAPDQPQVPPGKTFTYLWKINVGPGIMDLPCSNTAYYSDVDVTRDVNTGLIGTLAICRPGTLNKQGKRGDIETDFAIYYSIVDEDQSWLRERNIDRCTGGDEKRRGDCEPASFAVINGYIFGNQPLPTMHQWTFVDWYLMTMGDKKNLHPVHFHGNDIYIYDGKAHTHDVSELVPGVFNTVRMHTENAGQWLYHCHVHSHIAKGMEGQYVILPRERPPDSGVYPVDN